VKTAVIWLLQMHDTHFYKQGIKKLFFFYNKCIIPATDMVNSKVAGTNLQVYVFI